MTTGHRLLPPPHTLLTQTAPDSSPAVCVRFLLPDEMAVSGVPQSNPIREARRFELSRSRSTLNRSSLAFSIMALFLRQHVAFDGLVGSPAGLSLTHSLQIPASQSQRTNACFLTACPDATFDPRTTASGLFHFLPSGLYFFFLLLRWCLIGPRCASEISRWY